MLVFTAASPSTLVAIVFLPRQIVTTVVHIGSEAPVVLADVFSSTLLAVGSPVLVLTAACSSTLVAKVSVPRQIVTTVVHIVTTVVC